MNPILVYVLIIVILSFVGWAGMARIVRGMTLSVREREYVEAARSLGQSDLQVIVRHILPSTFTFRDCGCDDERAGLYSGRSWFELFRSWAFVNQWRVGAIC